MFLHIFGHVDAQQSLFIIEQESGKGFGEFGFTDPCRPEEHEGANRTMGILQTRPRSPHGSRNRMHRFDLTHNTRAQCLLHLQEFFFFARQHPVNRNACPARHHLRNIIGTHGFIHQGTADDFFLALQRLQALFKIRDLAIGQFACLLIFAVALRNGQFIAGCFKLLFEFLRRTEFVFFCFPTRGQ